MDKNRTCIDCKRESPKTNTAHTLIGPEFGWRLTRRTDERGEPVMEWRCRDCWRAYREARGPSDADPVPSRRGSGRGE